MWVSKVPRAVAELFPVPVVPLNSMPVAADSARLVSLEARYRYCTLVLGFVAPGTGIVVEASAKAAERIVAGVFVMVEARIAAVVSAKAEERKVGRAEVGIAVAVAAVRIVLGVSEDTVEVLG